MELLDGLGFLSGDFSAVGPVLVVRPEDEVEVSERGGVVLKNELGLDERGPRSGEGTYVGECHVVEIVVFGSTP